MPTYKVLVERRIILRKEFEVKAVDMASAGSDAEAEAILTDEFEFETHEEEDRAIRTTEK